MATTFRVMDTDVEVPMQVGHAVGGLSVFAGNAAAIRDTLPDDLTPVQLPGGRGIVLLLVVRYLDNPLGSYDEVVVGLAARPLRMRGGPVVGVRDVLQGRFGVWIEHMAVSEPFTREAGEQIWGYPKTLDEIDLDVTGPRATCTWGRDGGTILTTAQPTTGLLPAPPLPVQTYTRIDGVTMRTRLRARTRGVGVRPLGTRVELGDHRVAEDLADLGIANRPLAASWLSRVEMAFDVAQPLHGGTT